MRFFLVPLLNFCFLYGHTQQWEKAKAFGHLPTNGTYCWVVDKASNIYIAGNIDQNLFWVDNQMEYAKGEGKDLFLLKLDSNFNRVWLKTWNNIGAEIPIKMLQDTKGDLILLGTFSEKFIIGKDTLESPNILDVFMAKFDTMGNTKWAYAYNGLSPGQISCDFEGNIYFNGSIGVNEDRVKTTVKFEGVSLTTYGGKDLFIGCCFPNGKIKWAKNIGSKFSDYGNMFFYNNTIYLEGVSSGEFSYSQNNFYMNVDNYDYGFLLKMDNKGNVNWINSMSNSWIGGSGVSKIVVDSNENVFALCMANCMDRGGNYCEIKLENFKITSKKWPINFMVRFSRDGKALLLKKIEFADYFYPKQMLILNDNHYLFLNGTTIYEIDSLANRLDYRKNKLKQDFAYSSEPNVINNGKMWMVGEYNYTPFMLGNINLPKPDVGCNMFVARANFMDKEPLGIFATAEKHVNIYPNPANRQINVEFSSDKSKLYRLEILSYQGNLLKEIEVDEKLIVNVSEYQAGLYLFVLKDGAKSEIHKISIQH